MERSIHIIFAFVSSVQHNNETRVQPPAWTTLICNCLFYSFIVGAVNELTNQIPQSIKRSSLVSLLKWASRCGPSQDPLLLSRSITEEQHKLLLTFWEREMETTSKWNCPPYDKDTWNLVTKCIWCTRSPSIRAHLGYKFIGKDCWRKYV